MKYDPLEVPNKTYKTEKTTLTEIVVWFVKTFVFLMFLYLTSQSDKSFVIRGTVSK